VCLLRSYENLLRWRCRCGIFFNWLEGWIIKDEEDCRWWCGSRWEGRISLCERSFAGKGSLKIKWEMIYDFEARRYHQRRLFLLNLVS
jgi:hypothetical protein